MPGRRRSTPPRTWERYAAPLAFLVAATVAILFVRSALHGGSSRPAATTTLAATTAARAPAKPKRKPHAKRKPGAAGRYTVVRPGDSFGAIAARAGLTVAQIEQLNPGVASTSLHVGQKIRIG
ncbi:MAG TPA: LysM domain-containing protein [Gaiellaceae bacterium]|nr:LysM domain-containing protein [Gaiellaceae bacterium]